jgi:hypothetical protein
MASVQDAINQARKAAEDAVVMGSTEVEVYAPSTPVAPAMNYSAPSMGNMAVSTGISKLVEDWIKVTEYGLTIGADRTILNGLKVAIDMTEGQGFFVKHSIKYGNPAQYYSSYDGTTCDRGGLWSDAVMKAQRADPKAKTFPAADVIFTLLEDVKLKDRVVPAGTKLGHTTSTSNWQDWAEFYRGVTKNDQLNTAVEAVISAEAVTGKNNGYTWGIMKFQAN